MSKNELRANFAKQLSFKEWVNSSDKWWPPGLVILVSIDVEDWLQAILNS
jgi:hypothetical protein